MFFNNSFDLFFSILGACPFSLNNNDDYNYCDDGSSNVWRLILSQRPATNNSLLKFELNYLFLNP